ncbi:MAG: hypothetical protein D6760_12030 [Deltaproteobacteria bacterium]|nr:MAG: hypothetical protein D6760_12030 [Deltaproteobacteria bacterium]
MAGDVERPRGDPSGGGDPVERIETLADAMRETIAATPPAERQALYELAVRRVGDLPLDASSEAADETPAEGTGGISAGGLVAYGSLIAPLGLLVATVLPFGLVLAATGAVLVVSGLGWSALAALRSRIA